MRDAAKPPLPDDWDDSPEWTEEMFDRARPASDVLPPEVATLLVRRPRGRPPGSAKEQVTLRIDRAALDHFRAGGPGWQTRISDALRRAAGL